MSTPESNLPRGESPDPTPERPNQMAKPFYDFLLGRELLPDEIYGSYYIISSDVRAAANRIEEYVQLNEGTPVKILTLMYGARVPDDYLVACDPISDLLIVVQSEEVSV